VLETAGISPEVIKVRFRVSDNFPTDLPLETAMLGDVLLRIEQVSARCAAAGCSGKVGLEVDTSRQPD
jgi:hypothetical protein